MTQNLTRTHLETPIPLPVPLAHMLDRICVRPPYFALQKLRVVGDSLQATAPTELALGLEQAPIGAAEMGRHAAILGLCAAALAQPDSIRRYYLAQRARFTGHHVAVTADEVLFSAQLTNLDKRKAAARVGVLADGVPLGELSVDYTVLTENAFARLFRSRRQPGVQTSGYQAELEGLWQHSPDQSSFTVSEVPPTICAGHFENYPALPVAVLMNYLVRLGGNFVGGPYRSVYGEVVADDLCWAGKGVRFEVTCTRQENNLHHFQGVAVSEGLVKGEMTFGLEAL